jgi:hypothetical protein
LKFSGNILNLATGAKRLFDFGNFSFGQVLSVCASPLPWPAPQLQIVSSKNSVLFDW